MGSAYVVTELLYRASKDGFSASSFHNKCDNKGATIVIIRAKNNAIFGGVTSLAWNSGGSYMNDSKAFLFHITKKAKMEVYQNHGNALYGNSGYNATFGGGHDLHLCSDCNSVNSSYSNLGYTYKAPNGISYSSTEANNYLAGSYNFMVDEIEVFRIVIAE
jgi:hypothetical protein